MRTWKWLLIIFLIVWSFTFIIPWWFMDKDKDKDSNIYSVLKTAQWLLPTLLIIIIVIILVIGAGSVIRDETRGGPGWRQYL
tara:strand:+ start:1842 stop:2087 length:246 start_codon:yes stop_codon:yes gene_type:complete